MMRKMFEGHQGDSEKKKIVVEVSAIFHFPVVCFVYHTVIEMNESDVRVSYL